MFTRALAPIGSTLFGSALSGSSIFGSAPAYAVSECRFSPIDVSINANLPEETTSTIQEVVEKSEKNMPTIYSTGRERMKQMRFGKISQQTIMELGNVLRGHSYFQKSAEKQLHYKLGGWFTAFAPTFLFPLFSMELSSKNSLDALLLFFYCCYPVPINALKKILGANLFLDLCKGGLIKRVANKAISLVQIIPFNNLMIATDRPKQDKNRVQSFNFERDAVMTLYPDTYDLARQVKPKKNQEVIDLFCGNGVQALALAENSKNVVGVDVNDRALEFARFNAALNNLQNVRFEQCDLNKSIGHLGRFDLLVANPPFCPSIKQRTLFCDGGPYGAHFIKLLLGKRLAEIIRDGGEAYAIFPLFLKGGESARTKIKSFCSKELSYDMRLTEVKNDNLLQNSSYHSLVYLLAARHINSLPDYMRELREYYEHFKKLRIKDVSYNILELTNICKQRG